MKAPYEKLASALAAIEPHNERARSWLDRLILRCQNDSQADLDAFGRRASIETIRFDLQPLFIIQGRDERQKPLYREVELLLSQMEDAVQTSDLPAKK